MEKIAVVGLGYVGLPVALEFAKKFPGTVGYDINSLRVEALKNGFDKTGECDSETLKQSTIKWTNDPEDMADCTFFVIGVPTPIDMAKSPDLAPVRSASRIVGRVMKPGAVVVYESTVYPGVTEDICGPILASESGLVHKKDFKLGYSPERINPGDKEHTLTRITKVVSGEDEETLNRVANAYGAIIEAGIHRAPSIRVAEAAKVIENTQRDLNIALMNELAIIFDRLGIRTIDVLAAARTKWNFLPFTPGLVGGHCIGVDPYYLTTKAEELGYHPEVILAGRRINDSMGGFIAGQTVKHLIQADVNVKGARVGILGLTFKEDVTDLRNTRVIDIISELKEYGVEMLVCDPMADADEAMKRYGVQLYPFSQLRDLDGLVIAVGHREFKNMSQTELLSGLKPKSAIVDVKSMIDPSKLSKDVLYWCL